MNIVLSALAVIPAVGFVLVYARLPWRSTLPGRSAMLLGIVIAVTLSLGLSRLLGFPAPEWVRLPVTVGIVVALWVQFIALLVTRNRSRKRGRRELEDTPR